MKVLYFSWIRERIGRPEEHVELPAGMVSVADMIGWLSARSPDYAMAFEDAEVVRVAVNRRRANLSTPLEGADEVAFFPPMTGG